MKKIRLLAYTNKNFGDDLFVKTICDYFPNERFEITANKEYKEIFSSIKNIDVIPKSKISSLIDRFCFVFPFFLYFLKKLYSYKAVIYVIGALFDDDEFWKKNVDTIGLKKLKRQLYSGYLCKKIPFFLLGSNLSRVRSKEYIKQLSFMFDGLEDVCFRDKYSYDFFKELPNTRYSPDIVFNYSINKNIDKDDSVLISIWGTPLFDDKFPQWKWAKKNWFDYEFFIIEVIKYFCKLKKRIILLSLCQNEGDLFACEKIINDGNFSKSCFDIYNYDGDIDYTVELFSKASFVIGTRFHSIVMGLNCNTPVFPIVYENKTENLLKDIGFKYEFSSIYDLNSLKIEKVISSYGSLNITDTDNIKNQAKKQFSMVNRLLDNSSFAVRS